MVPQLTNSLARSTIRHGDYLVYFSKTINLKAEIHPDLVSSRLVLRAELKIHVICHLFNETSQFTRVPDDHCQQPEKRKLRDHLHFCYSISKNFTLAETIKAVVNGFKNLSCPLHGSKVLDNLKIRDHSGPFIIKDVSKVMWNFKARKISTFEDSQVHISSVPSLEKGVKVQYAKTVSNCLFKLIKSTFFLALNLFMKNFYNTR